MSAAELYRRGRPRKRASDALMVRDLDCRANIGPGVRLCAAVSRQIGSTIGGLRRYGVIGRRLPHGAIETLRGSSPGPGRVLEIGRAR
jgi:hypothetical protein